MAKQNNTISANQTRLATFVPSSINEEERTIEIVWTTGAAVRRWDCELCQEYLEVLEVSEKAVDLTRLNSGAPFINMHNSYTLNAILGVVERAWIVDGKGHAIIRFAKNDADIDRIWNLFRQGIIRNISVGYEVLKYVESFNDEDVRVLTAVSWTPLELSAVTVPADAGAGVRKKDETRATVIESRSDNPKEKTKMSKSRKKRDEDEDKKKIEAEEDREDENEDDEEREDEEDPKTDEEREDEEDPKKDEARSFRRQKRIYDLCEVAGVSLSQARKYCESKRSIEQIRRELVNSRAADSEKNTTNPYQRMTSGSKSLSQRTAERFGRKEA